MNKNLLYRSIPKVDVLLEDEAIQGARKLKITENEKYTL